MEEEKIITEFGAEDGKVYRVTRAFQLQTRVGPSEVVPKGSLVRLLPETAAALFFANRTEPVGEIGPEFEALRDFCSVTAENEWLWLRRGDVLRMSKKEGLEQMRKMNVRERRTNQ